MWKAAVVAHLLFGCAAAYDLDGSCGLQLCTDLAAAFKQGAQAGYASGKNPLGTAADVDAIKAQMRQASVDGDSVSPSTVTQGPTSFASHGYHNNMTSYDTTATDARAAALDGTNQHPAPPADMSAGVYSSESVAEAPGREQPYSSTTNDFGYADQGAVSRVQASDERAAVALQNNAGLQQAAMTDDAATAAVIAQQEQLLTQLAPEQTQLSSTAFAEVKAKLDACDCLGMLDLHERTTAPYSSQDPADMTPAAFDITTTPGYSTSEQDSSVQTGTSVPAEREELGQTVADLSAAAYDADLATLQ